MDIVEKLKKNPNKVYLIAEIGINHNADLDIIKRLIDATYACQWDCVKFQKKIPELCVPLEQQGIIKDTPWGKITYLEYKKRMELNKNYYDYINEYCSIKPINWSASVWDIPSLHFILDNYKVPFIKIPSAKITDIRLLNEINNNTVILSTGMSTMREIKDAIHILNRKDNNNEIIILHCNSSYPAKNKDLNLEMIKTLQEEFKTCFIGYSGHEEDLEPSVIAAVLGARVIERHITLDHNMWGTDQKASLEIQAMNILRKRIEQSIEALGDGIKTITEEELIIKNKLRG